MLCKLNTRPDRYMITRSGYGRMVRAKLKIVSFIASEGLTGFSISTKLMITSLVLRSASISWS